MNSNLSQQRTSSLQVIDLSDEDQPVFSAQNKAKAHMQDEKIPVRRADDHSIADFSTKNQ